MNKESEFIIENVKKLIERTSKILESIKSMGKDVLSLGKKYNDLERSVGSRFVVTANRLAKPLNLPPIKFEIEDDEAEMKEITSQNTDNFE